MENIPNGYYLKARCIKNSEIAHAPPHVREIWDWLIREANHQDSKVDGVTIKRGQCLRSYKDIQEGLHWTVGWRKMRYSKAQCETAMKHLKRTTMITTKKTTRGMLITILNYDKYQCPENYDNHRITTHVPEGEPQSYDTINKNNKNVRINNPPRSPLEYPEWLDKEVWSEFKKFRTKIKAPLTLHAEKLILTKLENLCNGSKAKHVDILNQSIERGWKGVFPLKADSTDGPGVKVITPGDKGIYAN